MKKNSPEWLAEEQRLKNVALELLLRSQILKEVAEKIYQEIKAFRDLYPDEVIEKLTWEEKEKVIEQTSKLDKNLGVATEWVRKIDAEYCVIREKVNAFYGSNVMKESTPLPEFGADEEKDPADWWKKE